MERLHRQVPEFRRKQGLGFPLAGLLALIAMATFSGVTKGYDDLADYAATLSQSQLRALKFHLDRHTGRVRCPKRTTFARVLAGVDAARLEQVLLLWQEQVLGPVQDRLVIFDGKEIRHADVESVIAVSGSGRWLGSTLVKADSNEIPAARELLGKLDVVEKFSWPMRRTPRWRPSSRSFTTRVGITCCRLKQIKKTSSKRSPRC
jgi:hypothetical protein